MVWDVELYFAEGLQASLQGPGLALHLSRSRLHPGSRPLAWDRRFRGYVCIQNNRKRTGPGCTILEEGYGCWCVGSPAPPLLTVLVLIHTLPSGLWLERW